MQERKRARAERGAEDVLLEPGKEEQLADRRAVASGEEDNQHEENRMRDTTVAKENRRQQVKNNLTN